MLCCAARLVLGDESASELLCVKRISIDRDTETALNFQYAGRGSLTLYLMGDTVQGLNTQTEVIVH